MKSAYIISGLVIIIIIIIIVQVQLVIKRTRLHNKIIKKRRLYREYKKNKIINDELSKKSKTDLIGIDTIKSEKIPPEMTDNNMQNNLTNDPNISLDDLTNDSNDPNGSNDPVDPIDSDNPDILSDDLLDDIEIKEDFRSFRGNVGGNRSRSYSRSMAGTGQKSMSYARPMTHYKSHSTPRTSHSYRRPYRRKPYHRNIIRNYDYRSYYNPFVRQYLRPEDYIIYDLDVYDYFEYPTRGEPNDFHIIGTLTTDTNPEITIDNWKQTEEEKKSKKEDKERKIDKDNRVLKLFGRQRFPGSSSTWDYYTIISMGNESVKIDLGERREIYDAESIKIPELNDVRYKLKKYPGDIFRYNPFLD